MAKPSQAETRNFVLLLVQGVARRVANELSSEKLVLPFIYTALGGAVIFSGLFAPVIIISRLAAQLFGARLVSLSRQGKLLLASSTGLSAVVLALLAGFTADLAVNWLPFAYVMASVLLGAGSGFGALVFQDLIGRVLSERPRVNLLFAIGAFSGFMVIVITLASQYVTGFEGAGKTARDHIHLIWAGVAMMSLSTLSALFVREPPRVTTADASANAKGNYMASLYDSTRAVMRLSWFRRFMFARVLFIMVEMVMPFFAVHAATYHARSAPSLSIFVIAFSIGMIAGGVVWPPVSRKSIQLVLSLASLVAGLAAALAFANHMTAGVQSPYLHAAMIMCLGFATQGTLDGSTAYVVGSSTDEQRPYCIAVSNLVAGVVGVPIALAAGLIAEGMGVVVAILLMGLANLAAAVFARTLPDVEPDGDIQPAESPS
jgi:MFS family permease